MKKHKVYLMKYVEAQIDRYHEGGRRVKGGTDT